MFCFEPDGRPQAQEEVVQMTQKEVVSSPSDGSAESRLKWKRLRNYGELSRRVGRDAPQTADLSADNEHNEDTY